MRHRRRPWRPLLIAVALLLLAPDLSFAQVDDVIELRPPGSQPPVAIAVPGSLPALVVADEAPMPTTSWAEPGGHIIDNLPNAFADAAVGGTDAESLVIGPPGRWVPRVGAQYLTEGVGYDEAFLFLSGAVPVRQRHGSKHELEFVEFVGGVSNHSQATGSVEWVDREFEEGKKRVRGGYWAFDYRDSRVGDYRQFAFGGDRLGVSREFRWNAYIPLGRNQKFVSQTLTAVPIGTALVPSVQTNFETAMYGGDLEWGWRILPLDKSGVWWLIGGYHFQAGGVEQVWGVKTRAELRLWDFARLAVEYQRDDVFKSNVVFAGEILLPGAKPRGRPDDCYITDRLGEPVRRWRTVTLAQSSDVRFF
jgi:hypothetical protein